MCGNCCKHIRGVDQDVENCRLALCKLNFKFANGRVIDTLVIALLWWRNNGGRHCLLLRKNNRCLLHGRFKPNICQMYGADGKAWNHRECGYA